MVGFYKRISSILPTPTRGFRQHKVIVGVVKENVGLIDAARDNPKIAGADATSWHRVPVHLSRFPQPAAP